MTGLAAFKVGDADQIIRIDVQDALDLQATGKYILDKVAIAVVGLGPDGGNPKSPFADTRIRKAVAYAIDGNAIAKNLSQNLFTTATQIRIPGAVGHNPAVKGYPYDPRKSKELLTQAGYPNGFKTRLIYRTADDEKLMVALQAFLKAVNIDATMDAVSYSQYSQISNTGWENGLIRWYMPSGIDMHPGQGIARNLSRQATLFKRSLPSRYPGKKAFSGAR